MRSKGAAVAGGGARGASAGGNAGRAGTAGTWLLLTCHPVRTRDLPFAEEDYPPSATPEQMAGNFLSFYYEVRF